MTITELIARLEAVRAEHGDLPVYFWCVDRSDVRELATQHVLVWGKGEAVGGMELPKRVQIPS